MSTYGLVLIVDVEDADGAERVADAVLATLSRVYPEQLGVADDMDYEIEDTDSGARLLMNGQGVVAGNQEESFFVGAPAGRAVICEDGDEFGVTFSVWRLDPAGSECVYRVSVPYEDEELEPEIAARVIVGARAGAAAAELYGVDAQRLLDLENDPTPVSDELGLIGTPFFPWLDHFGLDWPDL